METSEIITLKAHELFSRNGIKPITMDNIAAQLGMAKKTIYKYFKNKNALVKIFIERQIEDNIAGYKIILTADNNAVVSLFLTLLYAQRFYLKVSVAVIHDLERNHYETYRILKQYKDDFIFEAIKSSMKRGITEQLYQTDFNVDAMARFFLESLVIISDRDLFSGIVPDEINISENILGHMINGITTPMGTELISRYKDQHRSASLAQTLYKPFWED